MYKCNEMEKSHHMLYTYLGMTFCFIVSNLLIPLLFIEIIRHN